MAFLVNEFRAQMIGDGARGNLFQVNMAFPAIVNNATASQKISFMTRAAQLPGSSIGSTIVPYFGREVKLAGNRTFPNWTVTVLNDEDFVVRNAFEKWMDIINSHSLNIRNPGAVNSLAYTTDATIIQYSKTGIPIKTYKFVGLFPIDVSPIETDWAQNDQVEEFSTTFEYQYWTSEGPFVATTT